METISLLAFGVLLLQATDSQDTPGVTCDLSKACEGKLPGDRVADPADCHNYYVCVDVTGDLQPSAAPIPCGPGLYFDPGAMDCVNETLPCSSPCRNNCSTTCTAMYDVIAYPTNCSRYYICLVGGDTLLAECPDDMPYFDGANCTNYEGMCCDFCSVDCPVVGVQIADPCDCTQFYICEAPGAPSNHTLVSCPDGQHFDISAETCVDGSACDPLCDCSRQKYSYNLYLSGGE